jgi:hypothetical protein
MADTLVHVKSTGGKVAGASDADDWTDANCYATIAAALDALGAGAGVDGDHTAIFDDETHTITGNIRARDVWEGTPSVPPHLVYSRSGDATACIVQNSDARMWRLDEEVETISLKFSNFSVQKTATIADGTTGAPFFQVQNNLQSLELENFGLGPITVVDVGASGTQSLIRLVPAIANTTTLNHVFLNGAIAWTGPNEDGVIARVGANATLQSIRGTSFQDITLTNKDVTSNTSRGFIHANGGTLLLRHIEFHDVTVDNLNATTGTAGFVTNPPILIDDVADVTHRIDYALFTSISVTGGTSRGFGIRSEEKLNLGTAIAHNCTSRQETDTTGRGLLHAHNVQDPARTSEVTAEYLEVKNSEGSRGCISYYGGGGTGTINRARGENLTVEGAAIYLGGDGDFTLNAGFVTGCDYRNDGDDEAGQTFNAIINSPIASNTTRSVTVRNLTSVFNEDTSGANLAFGSVNANEASFTMTLLVENVIFDNTTTASNEFQVNNSLGTLNATFNNCYIRGGVTDLGTVSPTTSNITTSGGAKVRADGRLDGDSPCIATGKNWWGTSNPPHGVDGMRYYAAPSMGGFEDRKGNGGARGAGARPVNVLQAGVDLSMAKNA